MFVVYVVTAKKVIRPVQKIKSSTPMPLCCARRTCKKEEIGH